MARSKVAEELRQIDAAAIAAMTPAERLELAFELGRRGVEMYMTAHHVDYETRCARAQTRGPRGPPIFALHGRRSDMNAVHVRVR